MKKETIGERKEKREMWASTLPSFRHLADPEHIKFALAEAEKQLVDTIDTSQVIVARTTILITLVSGLMIALVGSVISMKISDKPINHQIVSSAILLFIYLLPISFFLMKNILGQSYFIHGGEPKDLFIEGFYKTTAPKEKITLMYLISQLKDCQEKIDNNKISNQNRWGIFNLSLKLVFFTPIAMVVFYFVSRLFC